MKTRHTRAGIATWVRGTATHVTDRVSGMPDVANACAATGCFQVAIEFAVLRGVADGTRSPLLSRALATVTRRR